MSVRRSRTVAFACWMLVGAAAGLGVLTPFTLGPWLIVGAAVVAVLLALTLGGGPALAGLLSGAGVVPLFVAWLNRAGPGTVCTTAGGGEDCLDEWSPWPWIVVGAALIVAGAVLYRSLERSARRGALGSEHPAAG